MPGVTRSFIRTQKEICLEDTNQSYCLRVHVGNGIHGEEAISVERRSVTTLNRQRSLLRGIRRQTRSDLLRIPRSGRRSRIPTESSQEGRTDSELGAAIFTSVKNTTYMSTNTPRIMNSRKRPRNRKMARSKGLDLFLLSISLIMDRCTDTRRYSCGHPRPFSFFLHEIPAKNRPHFSPNKQMQNNMHSVQSV